MRLRPRDNEMRTMRMKTRGEDKRTALCLLIQLSNTGLYICRIGEVNTEDNDKSMMK